MFIKLNLKNAYYCIRIKKDNKWKTAFYIYYNHFKYIIMSFKLINVSAIFQVYINWALTELIDVFCVRYITHDSCAISVVPPFNRLWARVGVMVLNMRWLPYPHKPKVMSSNHVACAFFPPVRSWVSDVWACRPIAG